MEEGKKNKGSGKVFWLFVLIVIVAAVVLWQADLLNVGAVSGEEYQAVFLTNNQVYFGKLVNRNSQYPVLKDIYYLQVTQTLQPRDENQQPIPNLNLVKLGAEVHGPQDEMVINRDHIMFYEDLKEDSQVVRSIRQFQASQE
ncbi:MAG TPA: hypothetical protein VJB92_01900 [Candidatus Paceibacterota bacterium]